MSAAAATHISEQLLNERPPSGRKIDCNGRILFPRTCDAAAPELADWCELSGGGIDPGESWIDAAMGELREETGIFVKQTVSLALLAPGFPLGVHQRITHTMFAILQPTRQSKDQLVDRYGKVIPALLPARRP